MTRLKRRRNCVAEAMGYYADELAQRAAAARHAAEQHQRQGRLSDSQAALAVAADLEEQARTAREEARRIEQR